MDPLFEIDRWIYDQTSERRFKKLQQKLNSGLPLPFSASIFHAQGINTRSPYFRPTNHQLWQCLNQNFYSKEPEPSALNSGIPDLEIFTCTNFEEEGSLEKSLRWLGFDMRRFYVLGRGIKSWSHSCKIQLMRDALQKSSSEYILYCDSHDCLITSLLNLRKKFESFACEILYNGERKICHPHFTKRFERNQNPTALYPFLNSGIWMARTDFARQFYRRLARFGEHPLLKNSDQAVIKYFFSDYAGLMRVDAHAKVFQTLQWIDFPRELASSTSENPCQN